MRFIFRGVEFTLRFKHLHPCVDGRPDKTQDHGTFAMVFPSNAPQDIAQAFAKCHPGDKHHPADNFCRETGRKTALTRLVRGMPREFSAAVWAAYHRRGAYKAPDNVVSIDRVKEIA